ncbi:hypothetical protein F503_04402 [Ophiostoma piceae UAMH 11346]|uniref:N-acetylglucosamine-induced protein 1 n=1 Tax=Ophiostoma piceae (strain UAMH 11346) TaxID=1262450 RepID=S3D601_OPHP1|nr:hypothetical protein F503_04402 [Ophiostoma piceae UAMH 11346]
MTPGPLTPEEHPFPLTDTDRYVLSLTDDDYVKHDWEELKSIIKANDLAVLKRKPSDLRRYMKWTADTKTEYGSITNYLIAHRLPKTWGSPPYIPISTTPFAELGDYCVLTNDWPYGLADDITHIVVWTRALIPIDDGTGDMTPESRALVAAFVQRYFVDRLDCEASGSRKDGQDRVLWFKNWAQLQSVRQLEHIHVLVRNASADLIKAWTEEFPCHKVDAV